MLKFNCNTLSLVNCATASNGDDEFCKCNTCSENQGDCDAHDECQDGLACGSNNCPASLGFDSEVDCCYQPTLGDEDFCASGIPCDEDEGDCDSNNECNANLVCDIRNSCPAHLGFASDVNCCSNIIGGKFVYLLQLFIQANVHPCTQVVPSISTAAIILYHLICYFRKTYKKKYF